MAKRNKRNKKPGKAGKIALATLAALLLALLAVVGVGAVNAGIVRIRRAEVLIPDLPAGFDGLTALYASDIDLCGVNTPRKAGALFDALQSLQPDMLLLGGDYTSDSLLEVLNRPDDTRDDASNQLEGRADFFHYISAFDAPVGKFAIASPEDADWPALKSQLEACGVVPLVNDRAAIRRGDDALWLVGVAEERADLNAAGRAFRREDCVIVVAYSPTVLPILLTSEAEDSGRWADLALCGHTHGGQVRLFGRSALALDSREQRMLSGWSVETGLPVLVTQGVGCEGLNVRLGSAPEVWMLTLRRG